MRLLPFCAKFQIPQLICSGDTRCRHSGNFDNRKHTVLIFFGFLGNNRIFLMLLLHNLDWLQNRYDFLNDFSTTGAASSTAMIAISEVLYAILSNFFKISSNPYLLKSPLINHTSPITDTKFQCTHYCLRTC